MNYFFNITDNPHNNPFINNLKKNQPFKNKIDNNLNFSFKEFLKKNLDVKYPIIFNTINHVVPVKKPNLNYKSFVKFISIRESLAPEYKKYYKYIGQSKIDETYLCNLENFINDIKNKVNYTSNIWINFDKSIDSGLHFDAHDNILINFIGKKKILLAHPNYRRYMYFKNLPVVDLIND
jgi:hypothetical protein